MSFDSRTKALTNLFESISVLPHFFQYTSNFEIPAFPFPYKPSCLASNVLIISKFSGLCLEGVKLFTFPIQADDLVAVSLGHSRMINSRHLMSNCREFSGTQDRDIGESVTSINYKLKKSISAVLFCCVSLAEWTTSQLKNSWPAVIKLQLGDRRGVRSWGWVSVEDSS